MSFLKGHIIKDHTVNPQSGYLYELKVNNNQCFKIYYTKLIFSLLNKYNENYLYTDIFEEPPEAT